MAAITGPLAGLFLDWKRQRGIRGEPTIGSTERDGLALKHGRSEPMLTLSIRQPWAWAIIHAGKDVENRSENMARRAERLIGQTVLIHAGKRLDPDGFDMLDDFGLVPPDKLPLGGIIGSARIEAVMRRHPSRWAARGQDCAHRCAAPAVPPLPGTVGVLPCRRLKKASRSCCRRSGAAPTGGPSAITDAGRTIARMSRRPSQCTGTARSVYFHGYDFFAVSGLRRHPARDLYL